MQKNSNQQVDKRKARKFQVKANDERIKKRSHLQKKSYNHNEQNNIRRSKWDWIMTIFFKNYKCEKGFSSLSEA